MSPVPRDCSIAKPSRQAAIPPNLRLRPGEQNEARSIDQAPLPDTERWKFRDELIALANVRGTTRVVLESIYDDFCRAKADCFPGNQRIAIKAGCKARNVQLKLQELELTGVLRCVIDRSIETQRRIVLLTHPHAASVLAELAANPYVAACNQWLLEYTPQGAIPLR